jgi:hypothetical protein
VSNREDVLFERQRPVHVGRTRSERIGMKVVRADGVSLDEGALIHSRAREPDMHGMLKAVLSHNDK